MVLVQTDYCTWLLSAHGITQLTAAEYLGKAPTALPINSSIRWTGIKSCVLMTRSRSRALREPCCPAALGFYFKLSMVLITL